MQSISLSKSAAYLAWLVYHPQEDNNKEITFAVSSWRQYKKFSAHDMQTGYFGMAYKKGNTVIIAHRGTDDTRDMLDGLNLLLTKLPTQLKHAYSLTEKIMEAFPLYNIVHTGHSLGGAIAQLMSVNYEHQAITFDTPGMYELVKKMDYAKGISSEAMTRITAYVGAPNMINSLRTQYTEKLYPLKFITAPTACCGKDSFMEYTKQQHSMAALATELFKQTSVDYVQNWPNSLWTAYQIFLDNSAVWDYKIDNDWKKGIPIKTSKQFVNHHGKVYYTDETRQATSFNEYKAYITKQRQAALDSLPDKETLTEAHYVRAELKEFEPVASHFTKDKTIAKAFELVDNILFGMDTLSFAMPNWDFDSE